MKNINKNESDFDTYKHLLESDDISTEIENINKMTTKIKFAKKVFSNETQNKIFINNNMSYNEFKDIVIKLDDSTFEQAKIKYETDNNLSILDIIKEDTIKSRNNTKVKI